ncbi:MAG: hypothetical protein UY00_C0036G0015 [Candidatus Wolfebacteria bacterium GW2011_GWA1_47_6]|nr:MAG: hypothetical protein UY00_C0036G0015 [Candidatus Wolfebacteria bacterium GW2011_GWA1_47_6]
MRETSKKILSFYDQHIDEFGSGPRAVGWSDTKSQETRFAAMCKVGDLDNRSVLDVGCGLGDFYIYLKDRYQGVEYTGIDINPRYIEQAKAYLAKAKDTGATQHYAAENERLNNELAEMRRQLAELASRIPIESEVKRRPGRPPKAKAA